MPNVCILTDSTAQFTQSNFPGHERVQVIPFEIQKITFQGGKSLPGDVLVQRLVPPAPQQFIQIYTRLSTKYNSILVLMLSSQFNPILKYARLASEQYGNQVNLEVMDSQSTSIGLGMLVQLAAGAASDGASLKEIDQRVRTCIPHLYALFFIPELTHLAYSGLLDYAQAVAAEMMGILPVFNMDEGRLVPFEKVRSPRALGEAFQNFMGEFQCPSQVALVCNSDRGNLHTTPLRQFTKATFPKAIFREYPLQPHLTTLFGPHSIGLFIMESGDGQKSAVTPA